MGAPAGLALEWLALCVALEGAAKVLLCGWLSKGRAKSRAAISQEVLFVPRGQADRRQSLS